MTARPSRLAAAMLATLLAACGPGKQPDPPPSTPTTTAKPTPPTEAQAPRVANPLKADAFVRHPCRSLTAAQQKTFALDSGELSDAAWEGLSCFYHTSDPRKVISVTYASKVAVGMSGLFADHYSLHSWTYWEPAMVDGYPAVGYDTNQPDSGSCNFAVALTDTLYFWVTAEDDTGATQCSKAKNIASAALVTIRTGV
jgi:hypothetical protein